MSDITERQKELLNFIVSSIREDSMPPTLSEMADALKLKSKNAVVKLLKSLEDKGYIRRDTTARGIKVLDALGKSLQKGMVSAPLVGTVAAGMPILAEEHIEEWVNLPTSLVRGRKDVFLLRVRGESMINAGIYPNDLVIVNPVKEVQNREIVVALLEGEATVKRFVRVNSRAYLKAENPKFPNIYPQSDWTIQGKVVGVIRNLD
jgi:repressor LexA